jgi:hypothetical protein
MDKRWTYGWAAYWSLMPSIETMTMALRWVEVNPGNINGGIWIIKELFRSRRPDIIDGIKRWYQDHASHPVSETIKRKLRI